jgi:hypothetical protein
VRENFKKRRKGKMLRIQITPKLQQITLTLAKNTPLHPNNNNNNNNHDLPLCLEQEQDSILPLPAEESNLAKVARSVSWTDAELETIQACADYVKHDLQINLNSKKRIITDGDKEEEEGNDADDDDDDAEGEEQEEEKEPEQLEVLVNNSSYVREKSK